MDSLPNNAFFSIIKGLKKYEYIFKEDKKLQIMEDVVMPGVCTMWTMTTKSHFGTEINKDIIFNNIELDKNDIVFIRSKEGERCFDEYKSKGKKKKKVFHNSITLLINVNKVREKPINVKLFSNGAVTMTGCKTLEECKIILKKLYNKLANNLFVKNLDNLCINDIEINLINCGFVIVVDQYNNLLHKKRNEVDSIKEKNSVIAHIDAEFNQLLINNNINVTSKNLKEIRKKYPDKFFDIFWIIRDELLIVLKDKIVNDKILHCKFVKKDHAGVLIEYPVRDEETNYKKLTIIVFASGRINIAGGAGKTANINSKNILEAYNFISENLEQNEKQIKNNRNFAKLKLL